METINVAYVVDKNYGVRLNSWTHFCKALYCSMKGYPFMTKRYNQVKKN